MYGEVVIPPHEIPIWGLRLEVQGIINRYAEVFECSRDFITAAVYAIVSTICGKHIELFDGKYNNNPNHWICVVAPSGSNKSAPIKALLEPIFKEEKLRIKKFKEEYREYKKNGGEEPARDRLIVSDVTPEGLYQVLADKNNTKTKSSTAPCFFRLAISVKLQPMQNHVAVVARQALVGDETKMRMMSIGGAGALQCRLR